MTDALITTAVMCQARSCTHKLIVMSVLSQQTITFSYINVLFELPNDWKKRCKNYSVCSSCIDCSEIGMLLVKLKSQLYHLFLNIYIYMNMNMNIDIDIDIYVCVYI